MPRAERDAGERNQKHRGQRKIPRKIEHSAISALSTLKQVHRSIARTTQPARNPAGLLARPTT
jgi:hypothetical protein